MQQPVTESELMNRVSAAVAKIDGVTVVHDAHTISGTLIAIKAKWFLGERKATSHFTCAFDPTLHEVRLHERATETSWGLPPPVFSVKTSSQFGTRLTTTRTDTGFGGGGRLNFGQFRDAVEEATRGSGWSFRDDVVGVPVVGR